MTYKQNNNRNLEVIEVKRFGRSWSIPVGLVAVLATGSTMAADGAIVYPTLDFSTVPMGVWIAAVMAFSLMCGMAFIGLSALISVLRKSRGAVR